MMSSWHHGVSSPFTRTARTVCPQSSPSRAATAMPRAASLAFGAQASSRSRNTRSAPELDAFSHMRSLLAGVASSERRDRGSGTGPPVLGSDHAVRPEGGEAPGVQAEQVSEHRVVVGPEADAEVFDPSGSLAQHGDRRLDPDRSEIGIVEAHERSSGPEVL